jgi:hypothetical protein
MPAAQNAGGPHFQDTTRGLDRLYSTAQSSFDQDNRLHVRGQSHFKLLEHTYEFLVSNVEALVDDEELLEHLLDEERALLEYLEENLDRRMSGETVQALAVKSVDAMIARLHDTKETILGIDEDGTTEDDRKALVIINTLLEETRLINQEISESNTASKELFGRATQVLVKMTQMMGLLAEVEGDVDSLYRDVLSLREPRYPFKSPFDA